MDGHRLLPEFGGPLDLLPTKNRARAPSTFCEGVGKGLEGPNTL